MYKKPIKKESGIAAVEFSLVISIILLIFFGLLVFWQTFLWHQAVSKATTNSARILLSIKDDSADLEVKKMLLASINHELNMKPGHPYQFTLDSIKISKTPLPFENGATAKKIIEINVNYSMSVVFGNTIPFLYQKDATSSLMPTISTTARIRL